MDIHNDPLLRGLDGPVYAACRDALTYVYQNYHLSNILETILNDPWQSPWPSYGDFLLWRQSWRSSMSYLEASDIHSIDPYFLMAGVLSDGDPVDARLLCATMRSYQERVYQGCAALYSMTPGITSGRQMALPMEVNKPYAYEGIRISTFVGNGRIGQHDNLLEVCILPDPDTRRIEVHTSTIPIDEETLKVALVTLLSSLWMARIVCLRVADRSDEFEQGYFNYNDESYFELHDYVTYGSPGHTVGDHVHDRISQAVNYVFPIQRSLFHQTHYTGRSVPPMYEDRHFHD